MTKSMHITLSVEVPAENEALGIEVAEQLSRQSIGFALQGLTAGVSIMQIDFDEDAL